MWRARSCGPHLPRGWPLPHPLRLGTPPEACGCLQCAVRRVPHRSSEFSNPWEHIKKKEQLEAYLRTCPFPSQTGSYSCFSSSSLHTPVHRPGVICSFFFFFPIAQRSQWQKGRAKLEYTFFKVLPGYRNPCCCMNPHGLV